MAMIIFLLMLKPTGPTVGVGSGQSGESVQKLLLAIIANSGRSSRCRRLIRTRGKGFPLWACFTLTNQ